MLQGRFEEKELHLDQANAAHDVTQGQLTEAHQQCDALKEERDAAQARLLETCQQRDALEEERDALKSALEASQGGLAVLCDAGRHQEKVSTKLRVAHRNLSSEVVATKADIEIQLKALHTIVIEAREEPTKKKQKGESDSEPESVTPTAEDVDAAFAKLIATVDVFANTETDADPMDMDTQEAEDLLDDAKEAKPDDDEA